MYKYRFTHTHLVTHTYILMRMQVCVLTREFATPRTCAFFMNAIFTIFSPNIQPACVTLRYRFPETTTARRSLYLLALTSCVRNICSVRKNIQKVCLHTYVCKYVHIYLDIYKYVYSLHAHTYIRMRICMYIPASYEYSPWTMVKLRHFMKKLISFPKNHRVF